MYMKANVEGMRMLIYYGAFCADQAELAENEEEKEKYKGLLELLTPIIKAYCTDKAFEVCAVGCQVFGGYGYIKEYPQEQLVRDCKITSIYEGTNGIQAMDLLGRKLGMNKGKPLMDLLGEMNKTIAEAKDSDGLQDMATAIEAAVGKIGDLAMHMGMTAMSEKVLDAFGSAVPFLEVSGDVIMAWIHLWRAVTASRVMASGKVKKKDEAFYEGQIITAKFYIESILPTAMGKINAVKATTGAVMAMPEAAFMG
jgi:hypothetical protein